MRKSIAVPLGVAAVGLAGLGYAAGVEVNLYRVRRFEITASEPLMNNVLHGPRKLEVTIS